MLTSYFYYPPINTRYEKLVRTVIYVLILASFLVVFIFSMLSAESLLPKAFARILALVSSE